MSKIYKDEKSGIEVESILSTASGYTDIPPIHTIRVKFPRFLLAAFSKHRVLAFNGVSNRAVSTPKMLQKMKDNPMVPTHWGSQQKGMSGKHGHSTLITDVDGYEGYSLHLGNDNQELGLTPEEAWKSIQGLVSAYAMAFWNAGYHQELVSRLLEPFQHTELIVTATEWNNFLSLRIDEDAQGEFNVLAKLIKQCISEADINPTRKGFHLPMVTDNETRTYRIEALLKLSAARVCTISYYNHKNELMTPEKAITLYNHLVNGKYPHYTPLEAQARPLNVNEYRELKMLEQSVIDSKIPEYSKKRRIQQLPFYGSFQGWVSNRYIEEALRLE